MKSDENDGPTKEKTATGTKPEDESDAATSNATDPTTVGSPTTPNPAPTSDSSSNPSNTSIESDGLPTESPHISHHGISMVQSPSIMFDPPLSIATSEVISSERDIAAESKPFATNIEPASSFRISPKNKSPSESANTRSGHDKTQEDISESVSHSSGYTLQNWVQQYLKERESGICSYSDYPGTESDLYDYASERNNLYTTSLLESTAYLTKGSLGAAVLSMHEAYMIGGLWTSLCVTVFVGVLVAYTMVMLIQSAQKMYHRLRISKLTYPDLAEAAFATAPWHCVSKRSKTFRYIVEVSLLLQMFGNCCIYQIVIANCVRQIVESLNGASLKWFHDVRIYILICAPLLILLCLIRGLKFMASIALIADIFVAICVFATLYYSLLTLNIVHITERAAWKSAFGFFRVFGICMYGTSGVCYALPVENNMKTPQYFPLVAKYACSMVIFLSMMIGFFGYWAWGESCESPITVHMPMNIFTTIMHCFMVIMLSTTFAVNFWVPFRIAWRYILRIHKRRHRFWEYLYRSVMALLVVAASMIIPYMIPVMVFLGHFFLGLISLVFPAIIEFFVDCEEEYTVRHSSKFCRNTKNICLVLLGLTCSVTTIYSVGEK